MTIAHADESQRLRAAFAQFPSGVVALAAQVRGRPAGMVASAFSVGVSLDPPLVSVSIQHSSSTWPGLREADRIGVSVLAADQGLLCRQLAGRGDRFRDVGVEQDGDAVLIDGAALSMVCTVEAEYPAGDHSLVLLRVLRHERREAVEPLVFHDSTFRALSVL
jgi:flavin reductase (DIM6/NTAB) family NADH-FMN oxidoreductase RutF